MVWQYFAAQAALSLYSGFKGKQAARAGGQAARDAAYANASDIRDFGAFNAGQIQHAGAVNAAAIIDVGEINAEYIEKKTARNMFLYGIQADEDVRRHRIAEEATAGQIRARASGSGIQVNTGSPLQFLVAQVVSGVRNRRFMEIKHYETLDSMNEDGKDQAFVTRFTASKNAEVVTANAEANAATALATAELSAAQQERAGDTAQEGANIAGQSAFMQGVTGAVGAGLDAWGAGAFKTATPSFTSSYIGGNAWKGSWGNQFIQQGVAGSGL